MADWSLSFSHPRSLAVDACRQVLAGLVGTATVELGDLDGNPRDFYARSVRIAGARGELRLELAGSQSLRDSDDPEPILSGVYVRMTAPYATKVATWPLLTAAFGALGGVETTRTTGAAAIIDDADAAGDGELASRLRRDTSTALVDQARSCRHVSIVSPRVDIAPILAAYERPEEIVSVGLCDCGLTAFPAQQLARFPNVENLSIQDTGLRRIAKRDLVGFAALDTLSLSGSGLEDLDADVVEACPRLARVFVDNTPLSRDAGKLAALRARWPQVTLSP